MQLLKYLDTKVVFQEFPDEIALAINISGCPCLCEGCHSSYLAEDSGEILSLVNIMNLIEQHPGITCLGFMGGDSRPEMINLLASLVKEASPELKIGWYSGRDELSSEIELKNFDYIKIGSYQKDKGPLSSKTTNQYMWKIQNGKVIDDITHKFQSPFK